MNDKRDNRRFWDRYARFYDLEIKAFNGRAYAEMYRMMGSSLSLDMNVLEVATGTGVIALNIAIYVKNIEAIDFSPKMIETAKKKKAPQNVKFSVEDATALSFPDEAFDAVIISNAMHVMPEPEKALANIRRVLRPKGLLIAPNYAHGHMTDSTWSFNAKILKLIGFETYAKWMTEEYVDYISINGFAIEYWTVLRAAFPLVYLTARKICK
jgi:ubiquinone/menaquinone biosynthesis C-methylase UbiE